MIRGGRIVVALALALVGGTIGGCAAVGRQGDAARASAGGACSVNHPAACRREVFPPHGRCFPARKWDASPTRLPCVEVRRVEEDGSFIVAVLDGDGTVRYSRGVGVPNAYERALP